MCLYIWMFKFKILVSDVRKANTMLRMLVQTFSVKANEEFFFYGKWPWKSVSFSCFSWEVRFSSMLLTFWLWVFQHVVPISFHYIAHEPVQGSLLINVNEYIGAMSRCKRKALWLSVTRNWLHFSFLSYPPCQFFPVKQTDLGGHKAWFPSIYNSPGSRTMCHTHTQKSSNIMV